MGTRTHRVSKNSTQPPIMYGFGPNPQQINCQQCKKDVMTVVNTKTADNNNTLIGVLLCLMGVGHVQFTFVHVKKETKKKPIVVQHVEFNLEPLKSSEFLEFVSQKLLDRRIFFCFASNIKLY